MPDTLGNSTSRTLIELTDLILRETDKEKKKALRKQHRELAKALRKLIDTTVKEDTAKYRRAKEALDKACDAIREAKKDIEKVAQALRKIATAIRAVEKLVTTLS